ncbi:MAG: hypothetical protein WAK17_17715 [Candidatus Nitrosopolaris sp.]
MEGKILQDADRLDAEPLAPPPARTFSFGGSENRSLYNEKSRNVAFIIDKVVVKTILNEPLIQCK